MLGCPVCYHQLHTVRHGEGIYFACDHCGGRAVTVPQIRRMAGDRLATQVLRQMRLQPAGPGIPCPFCNRPMQRFPLTDPPLELEGCRQCLVIWFDPGELAALPEQPPENPEMAAAKLRGRIAIERLRKETERAAETELQPWQSMAMLFGLPVELNAPSVARTPWATVGTALLMVAASLALWLTGPELLETWGLIPSQWWRWGGATFLTSFFLHGSLLHLAANLYFLLVFSDNVEDYLGPKRWLVLLGSAALVGDLMHILLDPRSEVPCVGASGGISGLLTYYALQFPRVRLGLLIYWRVVRIPAWGALILWALLQFLVLLYQLHGVGHVSAAAHLGGAATGLVWWWMSKRQEPDVDDLLL
jgi:membrane associated rhomboid family serine protease